MGSNPFLIKLKTRVFSFFLRFSPFFSLFQSAPPEKVRCSQTADERFFASFLLRLGLFSPFSACFPSDISIISACCFSGYSQIWGQTANRPTSRNARWGTSLIIHSHRRLWYFRGAKSVLKITPSANTIIRIVTCFWLIQNVDEHFWVFQELSVESDFVQ